MFTGNDIFRYYTELSRYVCPHEISWYETVGILEYKNRWRGCSIFHETGALF